MALQYKEYLLRNKIYCRERIGHTLRIVRSIRALSQLELAQKAHIDQTYISKIEAGQANITLGKLSDLCESLDIRFSDLFLLLEEASGHMHVIPALSYEDKVRIFRVLLKSEC